MPDFKPKDEVKLDPPKNDPISLEELAKADGECCVVRFPHHLIPHGRTLRCWRGLKSLDDSTIRELAMTWEWALLSRHPFTNGVP